MRCELYFTVASVDELWVCAKNSARAGSVECWQDRSEDWGPLLHGEYRIEGGQGIQSKISETCTEIPGNGSIPAIVSVAVKR